MDPSSAMQELYTHNGDSCACDLPVHLSGTTQNASDVCCYYKVAHLEVKDRFSEIMGFLESGCDARIVMFQLLGLLFHFYLFIFTKFVSSLSPLTWLAR